MAKDAIETQQLIQNSAEEVANQMKKMRNWTKEMKEKEKQKNSGFPTGLNGGQGPAEVDASPQQTPLRSDAQKGGGEGGMKRSKTADSDLSNELVDEGLRAEADTYKEKGNSFTRLADYDNAIHFYEKAIQTFGKEPIYFSNLALCLLRKERYEECIEACSQSIEINQALELPKFSKPFYRRAQAYEALGEYAKAIENMLMVIQLEPNTPAHKQELARLRQRLSKQSFEQAAKALEKKVWLPLSKNQKYISFINKNPNYRSKNPMKRIKIEEVEPVVTPAVTDAGEKIPDSVIDKLFNNNTGECTSEPALPSRHSLDFGAFYRRRPKSTPKEADDLDDDLPPPPTSGIQFLKTWKDLSTQKRFVYLKNLSDKPLNKILGASLDSDILSDILSILRDAFVKNNLHVDRILLELAGNDQTNILSMFFSNKDKENLTDLVKHMKSQGVEESSICTIRESFNLA